MNDYFPIFRAGRHVDSKGRVHNYSNADVEALMANYDPDWLSAPFSTDHKEDGPAFGYAKKLKYENGTLYACFSDMSADLRDAVKQNRFGRVSIELFNQPERGRYLKAISLLGVKTPAIKGLEGEIRKKTAFSQTDTDHIITFEAEINEDGALFLKELPPAAEKAGDDTEARFSDMQARIAALEDEKAGFAEKFEQSEAERKLAQARLTEIEIDQQRLRFEQYLEEKIAYGSVMPAAKEKILELLLALNSVEKFSEADTAQAGPVQLFQEFLDSLPKLIDSEIAHGGAEVRFSSPDQLAKEIRAYQADQQNKGVVVSLSEALEHIKSQQNEEK